jgi:plasmid stability protein
MSRVATLHIRNVPEDVHAALREQARANGRSLNAEALDALAEAAARFRVGESIAERLRRLAHEIDWPPDAPKPEDLIREDRDSR